MREFSFFLDPNISSAESLHSILDGVVNGLLVFTVSLLDLFLLLDFLLLHVGQNNDGVHQFFYVYGMVVGVVAGVRVVTKSLLGWGHLGWGNMVIVEMGHLVGIVFMGVVPFDITLGWMV